MEFKHRGYTVKVNLKRKLAIATKAEDKRTILRVGDLALKFNFKKVLRIQVTNDVTLEELKSLITHKINIEWLHE